jgi:hypothetical protein
MYRTSTTLTIVENAYRRERAEQAFRAQRLREERRRRRQESRHAPQAARHSWRRALHLRPALPR